MIADCKAYIESKGLIWDNALNVDKGTWAGNERTDWSWLWGDANGKFETGDGIVTIFDIVKISIDIEARDWSTDKYFKCVFIPSDTSKGDYDIYVVHGGGSYAGSEDLVEHKDFEELAKKAIN